MRIKAATAALIILTAPLAAPARAGDPTPPEQSQEQQQKAAELAMEATQKLMQALELLIQSLPQYGMPRVEEDGSIVIPRLPKPRQTEPPAGEEGESESEEGMKL